MRRQKINMKRGCPTLEDGMPSPYFRAAAICTSFMGSCRFRTWSYYRISKKDRDARDKRLGYNWLMLKEHIEKQFTEGMDWLNYGQKGWRIDHIKPMSTFDYDTPLRIMHALENLRPMWLTDKSQKMPKKHEAYRKRNKITDSDLTPYRYIRHGLSKCPTCPGLKAIRFEICAKCRIGNAKLAAAERRALEASCRLFENSQGGIGS